MRRLMTLLCAIALCAACSEPPQKEIDRAQGAIDAARAAGAEQYATVEFTAATTSLKQAHDGVAQGDYRLALSRALDASERAQQSARQAADGKARARGDAEREIATTSTAVVQLRSAIKAAEGSRTPAPLLTKAREAAATFDNALQEARARVTAEQYLEAVGVLKGVNDQINEQIRAINDAAPGRGGRKRI